MQVFKTRLAKALHRAGYEVDFLGNGLRIRNHADPDKSNGPDITVRIVMLDREPSADEIEACYEEDAFVLIIADAQFVPDDDSVLWPGQRPAWLRLVHALHFGRVYTVRNHALYCVHLQYNKTQKQYRVQWFGPLNDDLLIELRGAEQTPWLDEYEHQTFRVAGFGDGTWWKGWEPPKETPEYEHAGQSFADWWESVRHQTQAGPVPPGAGGSHTQWWQMYTAGMISHAEYMRHMAGDQPPQWSRYNFNFSGAGQQAAPVSRLASHYAVLELADNAPWATVKTAYKKLARQYHPDVSQANDAEPRMTAINVAYQALRKALE